MSINRIALYHLETLIWIGRLGTFAAAAEQLNTTQPTISARITELESRLGVKLFQRNGRLMTLTPSGRKLLSDYQPIWEQLRGALLRSSGFENFSGIVRVGAGEIAAATCLPHFVATMKKLWQDLSFEIEIQLTAQLIQGLLAGRIDLAFAAGPVAHPALTATPIGAAELVWAASPQVAERIAAQDTDEVFSLWSLPSHSPIYQVMRDEVGNLFVRQPSISLCNNVRTIIDILKQGDGLALMPKKMIKRELDDTSLVEVLRDKQVQPIMFHVVSRADESDPVVEEILQQARKTVL
ncbi:LysR family transcriptional regulator [Rhizobium leguminosarum bv. viciae]|uniref:LysR family transcriptional regulator n=1 Tax=Rhizobium leguminosarum TaxID=384 RepID=UPI0014412D81|nr:LysR family transcriptional regulator [Rhizobium leguminosarum]NKJ94754.1 LysR family transcriptional regulator [Rhizobium leguminosarum bv. viciae]NKK87431.1 LysR family transcriptional regulator [Rhizobium leguminosarum bv. viciae]